MIFVVLHSGVRSLTLVRGGARMIYFFDFDDGYRYTVDDVGEDFISNSLARNAGIHALAELAVGSLVGDNDEQHLAVKIRSETGKFMFEGTLTLAARWLHE